MITTVIFDLDGTLLYTLEDLTDSVNFALESFNLKKLDLETVRSYIGNGVKKLVERAVSGKLNNDDTEKCLTIFKNQYNSNMYNKTKPYNGVIELLEKLKSQNINIAVVSNKFDTAVKELCKFYFNDLIDIAIGESAQTVKKPAPDGVLTVIKEFGEDSRNCVYVGDSEIDIYTAQNAGIKCISVNWGYKDTSFLIQSGAKNIVSDCTMLLTTINNMK